MTLGERHLFCINNSGAQNTDTGSFKSREIKVSGKSLETTPVFDAYWQFAAERQKIFLRKTRGSNANLTSDPVLTEYKFTNAYRASDRVSQYLIRNIIYRDDLPDDIENVFFRILLFKLFNKIETWEALEYEFGELTLGQYSFVEFDRLLSERQDAGKRNYSAAYIMPSAGRVFGHRRKHSNHLKLLEWMLESRFPAQLQRFGTMADGFKLLASAPSLGPFLAYQFITDLNYSAITDYSEREFVVAGPGALDGMSKCFVGSKGIPAAAIIQHMADHQQSYFDELDIQFDDLWGRELQLIDCQNLFCEISKYSRVAFPNITGVAGRTRIKQRYRSSGRTATPWYPPKWGLNARIDTNQSQAAAMSDEASTVQYTLL